MSLFWKWDIFGDFSTLWELARSIILPIEHATLTHTQKSQKLSKKTSRRVRIEFCIYLPSFTKIFFSIGKLLGYDSTVFLSYDFMEFSLWLYVPHSVWKSMKMGHFTALRAKRVHIDNYIFGVKIQMWHFLTDENRMKMSKLENYFSLTASNPNVLWSFEL